MNYPNLKAKEKIKVQLINLEMNEKLTYGGLKTIKIIRDLLSLLKELEE